MAKLTQPTPLIIGRAEECAILQQALEHSESRFVAVYGRRRIGKTYLIKSYYANHMVFEFSGANNASMTTQLQSFYEALGKKHKSLLKNPPPKNWMAAFGLLQEYLSKQKTTKKQVVFLDEVPWLSTPKSDFLMALDYFWNTYANWSNDVVLVICGSAASWIINNVVNNRGGLHNRLTDRIRLMPFTLSETNEYLNHKRANYTQYQILQLYMTTGGVPHYLKEINPKLSVAQNIQLLCFTKDGLLYNEFSNLYAALFRNAAKHQSVVMALAEKGKGLTRNQIIKACKWKSGGTLTIVLNELIESGFVDILYPFQKQSKEQLYRLTDEYSVFYLRFIAKANLRQKDIWSHISNSPAYKSWCGFAFESICIKHVKNITTALGISGMYVEQSSFIHHGNKDVNGVQVDLILNRLDGQIHLCEIKFSSTTFTITKAIDADWRNKIMKFRIHAKTNKAIQLTTISTYGITPNMYQFSAMYNLTADIFFNTL